MDIEVDNPVTKRKTINLSQAQIVPPSTVLKRLFLSPAAISRTGIKF